MWIKGKWKKLATNSICGSYRDWEEKKSNVVSTCLEKRAIN